MYDIDTRLTAGVDIIYKTMSLVGIVLILQKDYFLAYEKTITEDGKKRLSVLRRTNDGFEIAEEDLKIRGPGELSGLRQSGFLHLKFADLEKDVSMMATARDEVDSILASDPGLLSLDNSVIRRVLSIK